MTIKYSEKSIYRFQMYCFPRIHWSITTVPEQYELTDVQSHLPVSHIHHPDIELRIRHWEINLGICSHIKIQPPPRLIQALPRFQLIAGDRTQRTGCQHARLTPYVQVVFHLPPDAQCPYTSIHFSTAHT